MFTELLPRTQLKAHYKNFKWYKTLKNKLGNKTISFSKSKCLGNVFNKILKDYKIMYKNARIDKILKNEFTL